MEMFYHEFKDIAFLFRYNIQYQRGNDIILYEKQPFPDKYSQIQLNLYLSTSVEYNCMLVKLYEYLNYSVEYRNSIINNYSLPLDINNIILLYNNLVSSFETLLIDVNNRYESLTLADQFLDMTLQQGNN